MSSRAVDKSMIYALVNTYVLADRYNGMQREDRPCIF